MLRHVWSILFLLAVSGCATEVNFTKALEGAAKLSNSSKLVAMEAERDALKANFLHLYQHNTEMADVVCGPAMAIEATGAALDTFGDAIDTIHKVGEKPADTSYASYVTAFRKNKQNIADARSAGLQSVMDKAVEADQKKRDEAVKRCGQLFAADSTAILGPEASGLAPNGAAGFAALFAFNELIKAGLAAAEGVQRESAVIDTAKALVPGLQRAHDQLAKPITSDFIPFVIYKGLAENHPALAANASRLGATVTLHRWFVAQQIIQSRRVIAICTIACLGDPVMRRNLDELISSVEQYRSMAEIDPVQTLDALNKGIATADKAADGKVSWPQALDGLLQIADTVTGLGNKYGAFKSSGE